MSIKTSTNYVFNVNPNGFKVCVLHYFLLFFHEYYHCKGPEPLSLRVWEWRYEAIGVAFNLATLVLKRLFLWEVSMIAPTSKSKEVLVLDRHSWRRSILFSRPLFTFEWKILKFFEISNFCSSPYSICYLANCSQHPYILVQWILILLKLGSWLQNFIVTIINIF